MSDFFKLLAFLWNNRQVLLELLENLPSLLQTVGASMEAAGDGAVQASNYIRGGGGAPVNMRGALNTGTDVIEAIRAQVDAVKTQIDDLAKLPFFFAVNEPMTLFAGSVEDVSTEIQNVADSLNDVSSALNSTGLNLRTLGQQLSSAGTQLQQVS